jgi:hypothetical protein
MWVFSSNFDMVRRRNLEAYDTFEKVFELVCREAQVVRADVCEGKELGPKDVGAQWLYWTSAKGV